MQAPSTVDGCRTMPDTPDTPVYRHVQTYWMLWVILLATAGVASLML